jgi:hypothetical protein
VISQLEKLRSRIFTTEDPSHLSGPSFMRIAVPNSFSLSADCETGPKALTQELYEIWISEWNRYAKNVKSKRKRKSNDKQSIASPFPFPRIAYSLSHIDNKFSRNVALAIPGIQSSYLVQFVPCDLLDPHPHPDYFAGYKL